jgi:uncharacterized radical SAM superfamily protein
MRKIIDLMAITGFLLSGSMTAALVISYLQFNRFMDESMERIGGQITEHVEAELESKIKGAMPQLPKATGPALPF